MHDSDIVNISNVTLPIPAAARSRAWVCTCSRAGFTGSNPADANGWLSVVSVLRCRVEFLRPVDHSSRRVLQSAVCP